MDRGKVTRATVCHHTIAHKGDKAIFHAGPFISLCAQCHDGEAAQIEARGYSTRIGTDGYPTDAMHPAYRSST